MEDKTKNEIITDVIENAVKTFWYLPIKIFKKVLKDSFYKLEAEGVLSSDEINSVVESFRYESVFIVNVCLKPEIINFELRIKV